MTTHSSPTWAIEPAPCLNCGHPTRYRTIGDKPLCHHRAQCKGKPHPYGYTPRQIDMVVRRLSSRPGRQDRRDRP